MNWKSLFRKRKKNLDVKSLTLQDGRYRIEEAFQASDGTIYYQFDNALQIPADRAASALVFYEELNRRCTRKYLETHCEAVDKILTQKSLTLNDLILLQTIHNNLKERLNLAPQPEQIYKFASVVFFDASESPYSYDYAYNEKKIEKWKKDKQMMDFFLKLPMLNLIPHLGMSVLHFQMFLEVAEAIEGKHQADLQAALSKNN